MADLGFWSFAQRESDALALVDPFESELTRGELLAACNDGNARPTGEQGTVYVLLAGTGRFEYKGDKEKTRKNRLETEDKIPKRIDYTDELPRDPNGKLYKRKLRDPHWERLERAI